MGFKITRDYTADKGSKGATGTESIRQTGFNAMFMSEQEQEQCVYHGGTIKVRLRDEDSNVYFHAVVDDTDTSCELLIEWARGYAGATMLDLSMEHWLEESGGREHPYPSKDGKWTYYMD